jgi:hypothetical protein
MHKYLGKLFLLIASLSIIFACKKDSDKGPKNSLPIDTASADQYLYCELDTIKFYTFTKGVGPDIMKMTENSNEVTKFWMEALVIRGSQALVRNMEWQMFGFNKKRQGLYFGSQIFTKSRADILLNKTELLEKNYTIINRPSNQIVVTFADSNVIKGSFNFDMQSEEDKTRFIKVKNGIFKLKIR